MKPTAKTILVLGASGMLGKTVFDYLSDTFPGSTWGTTRNVNTNKKILKLNVKSVEKDFFAIVQTIKKIDIVINCIAVLKNFKTIEELVWVNFLFSHNLANLSKKYGFFLIHVSTDGVFSKNSKEVYEDSNPSPSDLYGLSKLLGEPTTPKSLTIRSSFLGTVSGLLAFARESKEKTLPGYANQRWGGCTTLQFSKFICNIITEDKLLKLRKRSSVFHFAPIQNTTKYQIVKSLLKLTGSKKTVERTRGEKITRLLKSKYDTILETKRYTKNLKRALQELLIFEQKYAKKYK